MAPGSLELVPEGHSEPESLGYTDTRGPLGSRASQRAAVPEAPAGLAALVRLAALVGLVEPAELVVPAELGQPAESPIGALVLEQMGASALARTPLVLEREVGLVPVLEQAVGLVPELVQVRELFQVPEMARPRTPALGLVPLPGVRPGLGTVWRSLT